MFQIQHTSNMRVRAEPFSGIRSIIHPRALISILKLNNRARFTANKQRKYETNSEPTTNNAENLLFMFYDSGPELTSDVHGYLTHSQVCRKPYLSISTMRFLNSEIQLTSKCSEARWRFRNAKTSASSSFGTGATNSPLIHPNKSRKWLWL
ncbi:hypothetical protein BJ165DRAFT_172610 [Panaeolus papilionaceus]|nr:hypothetical protein BJ165DRAFT_172610 [Panaeolus papilionaceus]